MSLRLEREKPLPKTCFPPTLHDGMETVDELWNRMRCRLHFLFLFYFYNLPQFLPTCDGTRIRGGLATTATTDARGFLLS